MKKILIIIAIVSLIFTMVGCVKESLLDTKSELRLTDEEIYKNPNLVNSVLANLYGRLPKYSSISAGAENFTIFDEAIWSGLNNSDLEARNNLVNYAFDRWSLWDYEYVRDINLAIDNLTATPTNVQLTPVLKKQFLAELRFLRAMDYFEMVKRMGGVPIITKQLIYDFNGDPSYLQAPRNKEEEVYDFIAAEVDAIKDELGNDGSQRRATKYAALALKSRAMLYAGSIAKYNNTAGFTNTSTPGGEAGIPLARANDFYQKSLDASREIITSGKYSLYKSNPNTGENFYEALTKKTNNQEVILAQDFLKSQGSRHAFTINNIVRSMLEAGGQAGASTSPTLNLVESFEYLDGTVGTLKGVGTGTNTAAGQTNWIFYDQITDIFANKDARLYGTVIYPGASFANKEVQMLAGIYTWNPSTNKYDRTEGGLNSISGGKVLTGLDGPHRTTTFVSNTGFYLRKYVDNAPGASTTGIQSDTWWVMFRLGEIHLNAAEAAMELGLTSEALTNVNLVRQRAGFPANSLSTLTIENLYNERRVELAFETHRIWDTIRWRIADKLWSGTTTSATANMYALYPYRIVRPGHPNDGKFVFDRIIAPRFRAARFFRPGNYYSAIAQSVLNNNPKIVRNPLH